MTINFLVSMADAFMIVGVCGLIICLIFSPGPHRRRKCKMAKKEELQSLALLTEIRDSLVSLKNIEKILKRIEFNSRPALKAVAFKFANYKITNGQETRSEDMKLELGQDAKVAVTGIVDSAGNPAKVEGDKLTWAVTGDLGLGDLTVADDGMSALFVRNGKPGVCTLQVSGDADLGEGEKLIIGEVELDCAAGEAVKFELSAEAVAHA